MPGLPKTPAEQQLEELRRLRRRVVQEEQDQRTARQVMDMYYRCGVKCAYPDVCEGAEILGCLPYKLTWLGLSADVPWQTRWLGIPSTPPFEIREVLARIRQSRFYDPAQEPLLLKLWSTKRMTFWSTGRETR